MGPVEAIRSLLDEQDADARAGRYRRASAASCATGCGHSWNGGGVLLRFAGIAARRRDQRRPRRRCACAAAAARSAARCRGTRPRTFAPFDPREPVLRPRRCPTDVGISRQLLAEPDADLPRKTWAALADGTPIVTAERRGQGLIVLFHVTADTTWSNLPLSGLFVDMLRRIVGAGRHRRRAGARRAGGGATVSPPRCAPSTASARSTPRPRPRGPSPSTATSSAVAATIRRASTARRTRRRGEHAGCRRRARAARPRAARRADRAARARRARSTCGPGSWRSRCSASRSTRSPSLWLAGRLELRPRRRAGGRARSAVARRRAGAGARFRPALRWRRPPRPRRRPPRRSARRSAPRRPTPRSPPASPMCSPATPPSTRRAARASPGLGSFLTRAHGARPGRAHRRRSGARRAVASIR